ncbi:MULTISPECIES: hypothetical protein [Nocardia]|uniref:hypothetical protein n=1 Tax=Nocardia TaxID=1817 RepID=UPI000ADB1B7D|nr:MULTISPECIES: hypothetical protein [Nocardia]
MDEIWQRAPEWAVGAVVILVAIGYIGRTAAETSETWARLLGPLGRRWRERGERRRQIRIEQREARAADLEDMTRQRDYLAGALDTCRSEHEATAGYLLYDARWHYDAELAAAAAGYESPAHLSLRQWRDVNGVGR